MRSNRINSSKKPLEHIVQAVFSFSANGPKGIKLSGVWHAFGTKNGTAGVCLITGNCYGIDVDPVGNEDCWEVSYKRLLRPNPTCICFDKYYIVMFLAKGKNLTIKLSICFNFQ